MNKNKFPLFVVLIVVMLIAWGCSQVPATTETQTTETVIAANTESPATETAVNTNGNSQTGEAATTPEEATPTQRVADDACIACHHLNQPLRFRFPFSLPVWQYQ